MYPVELHDTAAIGKPVQVFNGLKFKYFFPKIDNLYKHLTAILKIL